MLDNADRAFLPGLFVRVRVPVGKHDDALLVPTAALGSDQAGAYVLVVDDESTVEQRYVTLGPPPVECGSSTAASSPTTGVTVGLQRAVPGGKVTRQGRPPDSRDATLAKP